MNKYTMEMDELCDQFGWDALATLCPKPLKDIRKALDEGDDHLNSWGNKIWDIVALNLNRKARKTVECSSCGHKRPDPNYLQAWQGVEHKPNKWLYETLRATMRKEPWRMGPERQSLSMRTGALKHAARRAALGLKPETLTEDERA